MRIPNAATARPDKAGPFSSELSSKVIMTTLKDEVFPSIKALQELSLEVANYRQGFINSLPFFRNGLADLQNKFQLANRDFLMAYHKFSTPDELFKDAGVGGIKEDSRAANLMMDYIRFKPVTDKNFQEGFLAAEIIDRTLNRLSEGADRRVTALLSVTAITVSIIAAFVFR